MAAALLSPQFQIGRASCRERVYLYVLSYSSRRRHTRWPRDWSSDVCSSDLLVRSGQQKYFPPLRTLPTRDRIAKNGGICMSDMQVCTRIIDRCGDVVRTLSHGRRSPISTISDRKSVV